MSDPARKQVTAKVNRHVYRQASVIASLRKMRVASVIDQALEAWVRQELERGGRELREAMALVLETQDRIKKAEDRPEEPRS